MYARMNDIDRMFGAMDLLRNRMDKFFNDEDSSWFHSPAFRLTRQTPRTNLLDLGDKFEVQAEVPGIAKDDLTIKIQGNYLEISGKHHVKAPEGYKVHRHERGGGDFSRSFTLPDDVDAERAEAVMQDGILHLILPKSEAAKPRQITIN